MRKVQLLMHVSLDGFVGGPEGQMDWIIHDEQIFGDVHELLGPVDTALYGKTTYQMMAAYWPTAAKKPQATRHDIEHSQWVEKVKKIVVSKSLGQATWNNTQLIASNVLDELRKIKNLAGKGIMIFGSPRLSHFLMQKDFIDEYVLFVNPVILGKGIPLFRDPVRTKLKVVNTKAYKNGVIHIHYAKS